jgi:hypothetical protein
MPNDTKLGLLMGVAGVIAAAVLFFQDRPQSATAQPNAPVAAKPSQIFGKKPDAGLPVSAEPAAMASRSKPEPDAQPVSRTTK